MVLAEIVRFSLDHLGIDSSREIGTKPALQQRKELFESARKSIKIVSVEIPNLDDLEIPLSRGVEVEVVVARANNVMEFMPLAKGGVEVYELSGKPSEQYDIVDRNHIRYEVLLFDGPGTQFIVYDDAELAAEMYLKKFRKLKEKAEAR